MRVLICGAGKVTRHLLGRLGESWQITLVDKSGEAMSDLVSRFKTIQRVVSGDASSPVMLDEVRVGDFDYVLALTDHDKVNLAIVSHARTRGAGHILALVNQQENQQEFLDLGVRTVVGSMLLAQTIYHYLEDPRIKVSPLTLGPGEIMEIDTSQHPHLVGKKISSLMHDSWKAIALFRQHNLLFPSPDTLIEIEDRLLLLGSTGILKQVCDILECEHPRFPFAYGQALLVALSSAADRESLLSESIHLAQNIHLRFMKVLCSDKACETGKGIEPWPQSAEIHLETIEGDIFPKLQELAAGGNYGLVVIAPFKTPFFKLLAKPVLISFAHSLACPLLISRHTHPYRRILVPFRSDPQAELALEVAIDMAKQFDSEIATVIVEEPDFIRGVQEDRWTESILKRIREICHIHKFTVEEIVRKGNPVKEIVETAKEFNLMVFGSTTSEKGLFTPHVGELLALEAPCSVLVVTK